MKGNLRTAAYGLIAVALLVVMLTAPAAWATPAGSALAQTIPTRTPTSEPAPPTAEPPPGPTQPVVTPQPGPTGQPGAPTAAAPTATAAQGGAAACAANASLTLVADRQAIAVGSTVVFTATLTNTGRQPLRQVVLEDTLSAGLEPGEVLSGGGSWQGRTLRVTSPTLAVGARLVSVYSVTVASQPGPAITARASATTAGCPAKTATVTLALPPSELPQTGGALD